MYKILFLLPVLLSFISCKQDNECEMNEVQNLIEKQSVIDVVNSLFVNTDNRNWDVVESCFADSVNLDYTSMAGGEPSTLTPNQITEAWKKFLPGFESTHHQIENYLVKININEADLFCYGTASHYLKVEEGEPLWIVVGTYDFHLIKKNDAWKVDKMKFNFKYQTGNLSLPAAAQERLK